MSNFTIGYDFQPNDRVWVVDKLGQSVHGGICIQVDIKIYPVTSSILSFNNQLLNKSL